MAVLLASGVYINHLLSWHVLPMVLLGAVIRVVWLWGQFSMLSAFFGSVFLSESR